MNSFVKLAIGSAVALQARTAAAGPVRNPGSLVARTVDGEDWACKCYPGDDCWPKQSAWDALDAEVDGNLHVHIPPEAACYNTFDGLLGSVETYDADKCAEVTAEWTDSQWTVEQQALNIWKYWTNETCLPTTDPTESCTPGWYGTYVLEAKTHDHIASGINFARDNNLRLVIRNTGHDFMGRSTGYGSLTINTNSFQDIEFADEWTGPGAYKGPVVTIGAGVQGGTLLAAAHALSPPRAVVVGECKTVGVAGGYIQGGGHGPLTSVHGMAVDNTVQFTVITAKGESVVANEEENADLYFALRGGGPSTFGVVTSVTLRTHADKVSSGAHLFINSTMTFDEDLIWEGIRIFHSYGNAFVNAGLYSYFEIFPFTFRAVPIVAHGKTQAELEAILAPMVAELEAGGVPFELQVKEYPTNYDLYVDLFEDEAAGLSALSGGWGFTQEDVEANNDGIVEAFRKVGSPRPDLAYTGTIIGHFLNPGTGVPESTAALHPRWRNSTNFAISTTLVPAGSTMERKYELQDVLTNLMDAALIEAGPNGYAYINEADPFLPNFGERFWGATIYNRLKCIRQKWDPDHVFFAMASVDTEKWAVIEDNTRLCKRLD